MWRNIILVFEKSLRDGIRGWAWPMVILVAGIELELVAHLIAWISQLSLPPGIVIFNIY